MAWMRFSAVEALSFPDVEAEEDEDVPGCGLNDGGFDGVPAAFVFTMLLHCCCCCSSFATDVVDVEPLEADILEGKENKDSIKQKSWISNFQAPLAIRLATRQKC